MKRYEKKFYAGFLLMVASLLTAVSTKNVFLAETSVLASIGIGMVLFYRVSTLTNK